MTQSKGLNVASRFPDLPAKMRTLPVDHRGFPVPWFVAWRDGLPVFPAIEAHKPALAWARKLCWICGGKLGRVRCYVIGPMCAVNRVSSEPPSHLECARFAARRCPFLAMPNMKRVPIEKHSPGIDVHTPGIMIDRNPGVTLVWQALTSSTFNDGMGGMLFDIGPPHAVEWFREGRPATRAEVQASIDSGLPSLRATFELESDPAAAAALLDKMLAAIQPLLPA